MHRRIAEDEIAYAFASPSARQQRLAASPSQSESQLPEVNALRALASDLGASIGSANATTSEDSEVDDHGDNSSAAISPSMHERAALPSVADRRNEQLSSDEPFRHFRKKPVVTAMSLQMDVNDLKQEVANLLLLRSILASRVMVRRDDTAGSLVRTARAYYEHFRNGYAPLSTASSACQPSSKRKRSRSPFARQQVDQAAFLQSILSPTMEAGPLEVGVPLMLEQWRRYSAFFALHAFTMTSFDVVITDQVSIVRTKGEFRMHVTSATLAGVFPHIFLMEDEHQRQRILDRVLNRVVTCPCFIDLYFDAQGRVIRYDEAADFLGALSSLVRCPRDLVALFDGALLWEAGVIGSLEAIGIDDSSGAFLAPLVLTAHSPAGSHDLDREGQEEPPTRVRKLYDVDFLLNHEFMDGDEGHRTPEDLHLYEYDDDERTVYHPKSAQCPASREAIRKV